MSKYAPECPFCGRYVERPETRRTDLGEIMHGICQCGAVYVPDRTGRTSGEAYMEALFLIRGGFDIEVLDPDTDYDVTDVNYDFRTHSSTKNAKGKLIFVRMKEQALDTKRVKDILQNADDSKHDKAPTMGKVKVKRIIMGLLKNGFFDEIVELANQDKSVVSVLISCSYDKEDVVTWRAAEALGKVAYELSKDYRVGVARDTIRRLLWSMREESGGIGWTSAEMIGEIIRNNPEEFGDIIPIIWSLRDEDVFREGIVWAIGRIAAVRPDLVQFVLHDLRPMLEDESPAVRGYAAWVIGMLGDDKAIEDVRKLITDESVINFYRDGELTKVIVNEIAKEILSKKPNR